MLARFYAYSGKTNAVDKSAILTMLEGSYPSSATVITINYCQLNGTMRIPTDLQNPTLLVEWDSTDRMFIGYNYAKLEEIGKYYWIVNAEIVNNDLIAVELREDVLHTFREFIYSQNAIVNRCSSADHYDLFVEDGAMKFKMNRELSIVNPINTPSDISKVNVYFNPQSSNYILSVFTKITLDGQNADFVYPALTDATSFDNPYLPSIHRQGFSIAGAKEPTPNPFNPRYSSEFHSRVGFLSMNAENFMVVAHQASFVDEFRDAIRGVIAIPFVPNLEDVIVQNLSPFKINETIVQVEDGSFGHIWESYCNIINPTSGYLVLADFSLPTPDSFIDEPPYSVYDIFIPYCSWIEIPSSSLRSRLIVFYVLDYASGESQVNLYDMTKHIVLWSGSCQLGVKLHITANNQAEQNRQSVSSGLNTILQVGGGMIATVAGVATENPVAIAGGVLSMARGVSGYASTSLNLVDRTNVGYSDGGTALYQPNEIRIRKRSLIPLESSDDIKGVIGLPTSKVIQLEDLRDTGFANISDVNFEQSQGITRSELAEIESALKTGVIL